MYNDRIIEGDNIYKNLIHAFLRHLENETNQKSTMKKKLE